MASRITTRPSVLSEPDGVKAGARQYPLRELHLDLDLDLDLVLDLLRAMVEVEVEVQVQVQVEVSRDPRRGRDREL